MIDSTKLKVGDKLLCVIGDSHFSKGDVYKIYENEYGSLVIWCDDIARHFVASLKPTMFKLL